MQALLIIVLVVQRRQKRIVEQRLHEKNEELDQFFSVSLDLLCVANTDGYFVRLNPAFERLLGYTLQELMAKPFLSFVHPDDREATEKAIEGLKSQNVLNQFNNRYVCNDGTYRWLEWRAVQSSDLIYAAARDFTERKAVEETVRESENKYRSLYESMMDGYVLVSTDGKIKEYNESYREMLGYASEELNNLTYHELTPETWHSFEQVIVEEQVLPRGYSDVYEKEYIKKNGTIFPVELRTFLIRNETGRNVGMWAIVRDVTDRKRAGEALEERLAFEQLLSNLSARFVSISPDQMDTEIEGGLKQVLKFFQVERCGLLQISPDKASWQVTHVTLADNIPQVPLRMELPVSLFPYTYKTLIDERAVHSFSRLDDLPAEVNVDWQTNVEWGIRSGLYIPITTAGQVVRVMAIDSVKSEHVWPEELVSRLRLLGEIFANALELAHTRLQIADRLRFECLVSDLSAGFVNLPPDQVDSEINKWLRIITEFFDADRCTIGLFSEDRTLLERVFEYHSSDSKPAVESISKEQMPWYIGQLLCGNPVVINRVEDLPPEAGKERHVCLVRGMKSILSIPMVVGGTTLGSFVLVSTRGERVWPGRVSTTVSIRQ